MLQPLKYFALKIPASVPSIVVELIICSCGFTLLELPELPKILKILRIMCMNFNQKLKLPMNLEKLVIRSVNFNQQLRLSERLKSLRIYSDHSNQPPEFPENLSRCRSSGRLPTCGDPSRRPERFGLARNYSYIGSSLFS